MKEEKNDQEEWSGHTYNVHVTTPLMQGHTHLSTPSCELWVCLVLHTHMMLCPCIETGGAFLNGAWSKNSARWKFSYFVLH